LIVNTLSFSGIIEVLIAAASIRLPSTQNTGSNPTVIGTADENAD
jgi:hypothetical protein